MNARPLIPGCWRRKQTAILSAPTLSVLLRTPCHNTRAAVARSSSPPSLSPSLRCIPRPPVSSRAAPTLGSVICDSRPDVGHLIASSSRPKGSRDTHAPPLVIIAPLVSSRRLPLVLPLTPHSSSDSLTHLLLTPDDCLLSYDGRRTSARGDAKRTACLCP